MSGDAESVGSRDSGSDIGRDAAALGLTENQQRLLYLISLYSAPAETTEQDERWIRHQALMVLIYEGVVAQVRVSSR